MKGRIFICSYIAEIHEIEHFKRLGAYVDDPALQRASTPV
jgi:hypothetical protein